MQPILRQERIKAMAGAGTRTPDPKTAAAARAIAAELPAGQLKLHGVRTPLPEPIAAMLREILASHAAGNPVSLVSREGEMTPNEAADLLNVSRGTVTKLMEDGALPFRQVGSHRRIPTAAVIAYDLEQRARSDEALDELARLGQEMGLYEMEPRMPQRRRAK
jgi:excisionase family DNA binding protein